MNSGLLNHTYISRNKLFKKWRDGLLSKTEYDVLFQSIKVESQVIRSIQDVIELKQQILSAQDKDEKAFGEINVGKGFKIDPRDAHHMCPEQYNRPIKAEECYSFSRSPENIEKCTSCECYETVGKIFE